MSVSGSSSGRRSKSGRWTTRISGQRLRMAAGIISSARHCGKGCQTQTMSLVSAGLVRAMVNGASGTLWRWALEDAGRGAFQNGTDRVHPRLFSQECGSGCKLRGYGGRVLKSGEVVEREGDAGKSYSKWGPYTYRSVPSNNVAVNGNLGFGSLFAAVQPGEA